MLVCTAILHPATLSRCTSSTSHFVPCPPSPFLRAAHDQELLEKDQSIMDFRDTVEMLEVKLKKLEQLAALKDKRIEGRSTKIPIY